MTHDADDQYPQLRSKPATADAHTGVEPDPDSNQTASLENGREDDTGPAATSRVAPVRELMLGAAFGLAFGFLLQKGGVAKYHILMGVLLLEEFTVIKVMGSAVIVGMLLVAVLGRFNLVELEFKPTWVGANVLGGLIFGLGFGLSGHCPGTASAALGQGNFDALATMGGLLVGSLVFAEISGLVERTARQWGRLGQFALPDAVNMPRLPIAIGFAALLSVVLIAVERLL